MCTALARQHLGLPEETDGPSVDEMFGAFASAASKLREWPDRGGDGDRPAGQLRPLARMPLGRPAWVWATPLYPLVYDPDGHPLDLRLRNRMKHTDAFGPRLPQSDDRSSIQPQRGRE